MPTDKKSKKSPLKETPLRLPGQSLEEEINRLFDEKIVMYFLFATVFFVLPLVDWTRTLLKTPTNPWTSTVFASVVVAYCAFRVLRTYRQVNLLKLARDGERIVAEQLDSLREQGAAIIHDIVGDGFNVDHVILSSRGIFVAETKTRSKPRRGSPKVTYDGKVLLVDGLKPDRDPIAQVEANTRWVAKTLEASTGKTFPVKPVVLFPGWFVEPLPRGSPVWVLEPKALPTFVANEPVKISDSDLHLAVYHLTRVARVGSR